jgi:vesicle coat complex subunit
MILKDLCENLKSLDDPNAKASMIWIIGEYVDTIENADELLFNFAEKYLYLSMFLASRTSPLSCNISC